MIFTLVPRDFTLVPEPHQNVTHIGIFFVLFTGGSRICKCLEREKREREEEKKRENEKSKRKQTQAKHHDGRT